MARDRDHGAVAERARQDGARLMAAWRDYVAKGQALADIVKCPSVWPSSVDDVAPVRCQLLEGHDQAHRHRVIGSQVVVTW